MYLIFIFLAITFGGLSKPASSSSHLTRCKTATGQGLCVARRLCRYRSVKLIPCSSNDPELFCCPFPSNGTFDWSAEDKDAGPIVFPGEMAGPAKTYNHGIEDELDSIDVDIVFPPDGSVRKEYTVKPNGMSTRTSPTAGPSRVTSQVPKTAFQRPCKPPGNKPRRLNPALEINPEEKEFEIIPLPKIVTSKVPILKFSETPNVLNTPETQTSVAIHSTTVTKKVELPETTSVHPVEKETEGLFYNPATTKPAEIACGSAATSPNIAGGTESKPHQWPWMCLPPGHVVEKFNPRSDNYVYKQIFKLPSALPVLLEGSHGTSHYVCFKLPSCIARVMRGIPWDNYHVSKDL
ncbi:hypothetical protein AVEN_30139-1 [Araneus ventricosus]|uniref:Uncharacterized protein n=1 Tax=Araneus ventricosus TaxID=182803 RepID=A0A4Y2M7F4_ARAVE|nr:hypothetical protein AVEN_30139-1 [Araneus ventricosus]